MINDDKQFTMLEERKYAEKYCNIHKFENWSNSAYIELTFKAYISIYNGSIYIAISKIKKVVLVIILLTVMVVGISSYDLSLPELSKKPLYCRHFR